MESGRKTAEVPVASRASFDALILRMANGSDAAVWELLDRYSTNILRLVRRHLPKEIRPKIDSTDIVQSVWKSLLNKGVPLEQLCSAEDFVAYLAGAARLKVYEIHRHYTRCQCADIRREVDYNAPDPDDTTDVRGQLRVSRDAHADTRSSTPSAVVTARDAWQRAVDKCGDRGREVLSLKLQGLTLDEIAERLALSKSTVRRVMDSLLQSLTT